MLHLRRVVQKVCCKQKLEQDKADLQLWCLQNAVSRVGCTAASSSRSSGSKRLQGLQGGRRGLATATEPYDVVVIGGGTFLN